PCAASQSPRASRSAVMVPKLCTPPVGPAVGADAPDAGDDGLLVDVQAGATRIEHVHRRASPPRPGRGGPRGWRHAALGAPRGRGRQVRVRVGARTRLFAGLGAPSGWRTRPGAGGVARGYAPPEPFSSVQGAATRHDDSLTTRVRNPA